MGQLRNWFFRKILSAPQRHDERVRAIQAQVREWNALPEHERKPMCTARPGWQTISPQNMDYKKRMHQVRVNLVDILDINTHKMTVRCEPLVSMGQLSRTLNKLGWTWTIPILPELDDLTVGGLVMGTGIETSSHKYGLFQHICKSYELVMAWVNNNLLRNGKFGPFLCGALVLWNIGISGIRGDTNHSLQKVHQIGLLPNLHFGPNY